MAPRLSLKATQVIGVTLIVTLAIASLSAVYLGLLIRVWLDDTRARGALVASAVYQRAFSVAATDTSGDLKAALAADPGLRSILEAALYDTTITFAALTDTAGVVIAHNDPSLAGAVLPSTGSLATLISRGPVARARALYAPGGGNYDVALDLRLAGGAPFGTIHVGVSTLLLRSQVNAALAELRWPVLGVLAVTVFVAMLLANVILRPIAMISSRVARLGRGEFDTAVELPDDAELRDVSESIRAIGAKLAAGGDDTARRDARRLVALSRLSAGIAHEIKNPLNAMSIHLELLRGALPAGGDATAHLSVITKELRRLDEVVQTFLKFSRPEKLTLVPVAISRLCEEIRPVIEAEAEPRRIRVRFDGPAGLPEVPGDAAALQQALLNLALNACQAMPTGGELTIAAASRGDQVAITVTDTGVGIPPEQLDKIFHLYFTTKDQGTGIGLAMVYRTIQLHDGDITVSSSVGRGTTFTITLPAGTGR